MGDKEVGGRGGGNLAALVVCDVGASSELALCAMLISLPNGVVRNVCLSSALRLREM